MSAASALAAVALLTAAIALFVSVRAMRRLAETHADLESVGAAIEQDREAAAESIAAAQCSTVEEVAALIENALVQIDTETTAKVAEALAVLNSDAGDWQSSDSIPKAGS